MNLSKQNTDHEQKFRPAFTTILKPLFYSILFSLFYSFGYIGFTLLAINDGISSWVLSIISIIWLMFYILGQYFAISLAWSKKAGSLSRPRLLRIGGWSLTWGLAACLCGYFCSWMLQGNLIFRLFAAFLCAFFLICMIPASLLYFYGVYEQGEAKFELLLRQVRESLSKNFLKIVNPWLILFLILVNWHSMFAGPLSIVNGFNPGSLLVSFLFMGEPFCFATLLGRLGSDIMTQEIVAMIILDGLFSLVFTWAIINYAMYIRRFYVFDVHFPEGGIRMEQRKLDE